MYPVREIKMERLVWHQKINLEKAKLVFSVHRFSIYKLKITHSLYSREFGELNYLVLDTNCPSEKCLIYVIVLEPESIHKIKYWRATSLDRELAWYVIQAFISGYLENKYNFANGG
jgi:hypothetical protein